jgi:hypothetical protein
MIHARARAPLAWDYIVDSGRLIGESRDTSSTARAGFEAASQRTSWKAVGTARGQRQKPTMPSSAPREHRSISIDLSSDPSQFERKTTWAISRAVPRKRLILITRVC